MKLLVSDGDINRLAVYQAALKNEDLHFNIDLHYSKTEGYLITVYDPKDTDRTIFFIWKFRASVDLFIKALKSLTR